MNRKEKRASKASVTVAPHVAKAAHIERIHWYRTRAMAIIRSIRAGKVDEEDLDKLQNFVQTSLALMSLSQPGSIDRAINHAELVDLLKEEQGTDVEVVWSKDKLNPPSP